ncbi:HD-GYP domain-containing protein [Anaerocolumna xylanovorans]|uniref:HDIG domain-containing protein n=1 Tax=Anaerocolumna xylanovorans DSM 12503 TaxID=1121345 RepID=A0A1M7YK72_9FIRM|nr:HD-GYP domain-containing protein [Anaerocolumna xylanovorans]SHO53013.1 HDIG domain-containing protein [Anaerocolumna xylanovorans DSM 12503]
MSKQRISIRQARPGLIVADDIYNASNQLVISKGVVLTDRIITRLKFNSITEFNIILERKETPKLAQDMSYSQKVRESAEFKEFQSAFTEKVTAFKGELNKLTDKNESININELLEHTTDLLQKTRNGIHVFDMLHCMREYDDITYVHCMNVSLLSNVFGQWMKLPEKELELLTLAGLLHDIGKLSLPNELVNKQEKLTPSDYVTIKTHTIQGYNILRNKGLDPRIADAALMHHERCDGSGYPYRLKGDKIEPFAKIIGILDVYDAMTSARVYRPALSPFEAISVFESEGLQKYDPAYILLFLEKIVQAYVGNRVRLSNGAEGEIRLINQHALSKPIIQLGSSFIDLSKERELSVAAIL